MQSALGMFCLQYSLRSRAREQWRDDSYMGFTLLCRTLEPSMVVPVLLQVWITWEVELPNGLLPAEASCPHRTYNTMLLGLILSDMKYSFLTGITFPRALYMSFSLIRGDNRLLVNI